MLIKGNWRRHGSEVVIRWYQRFFFPPLRDSPSRFQAQFCRPQREKYLWHQGMAATLCDVVRRRRRWAHAAVIHAASHFDHKKRAALPVFKPKRARYESVNYRIQQLLIHIVRKNTPRLTKSSSLVFIRQVFTEIQRFENFKIYKEMYGRPDALSDSVRIWMAIHFFVNFDIFKWLYLSYYWVYLHQTWGFCKTWSPLYDHVDQ